MQSNHVAAASRGLRRPGTLLITTAAALGLLELFAPLARADGLGDTGGASLRSAGSGGSGGGGSDSIDGVLNNTHDSVKGWAVAAAAVIFVIIGGLALAKLAHGKAGQALGIMAAGLVVSVLAFAFINGNASNLASHTSDSIFGSGSGSGASKTTAGG